MNPRILSVLPLWPRSVSIPCFGCFCLYFAAANMTRWCFLVPSGGSDERMVQSDWRCEDRAQSDGQTGCDGISSHCSLL